MSCWGLHLIGMVIDDVLQLLIQLFVLLFESAIVPILHIIVSPARQILSYLRPFVLSALPPLEEIDEPVL